MRIWGFAFVVLTGCACEQAVAPHTADVPRNEIAIDGAVVGTIDFRLPSTGDSVALAELNRRAVELGADTVVGAQIVREGDGVGGDTVHVSGVAVRSTGSSIPVVVDAPAAPNATVPMYDDSTGPSPQPAPPLVARGECPQCYVATRFTSHTPSFYDRPLGHYYSRPHFARFR